MNTLNDKGLANPYNPDNLQNALRRRKVFFIVGPCALESLEQVRPIVDLCMRWNIRYFRAQLFKPRTHPNSFQGLGENGLEIIEYLKAHHLLLVAEACSVEQLHVVKDYADMIQIGARNMQNFELLKQVGKVVNFKEQRPHVLLKRGFGNTCEEWLASAEYLLSSGVPRSQVILCERGTRNYCSPTGVTLDLAMAQYVKMKTDYHVIADPSHGTREASLVLPLAKAALAMDLDGIMVEIHPRPQESVSDARQAISLVEFEQFLNSLDLNRFHIKKNCQSFTAQMVN